MTEQELYGTEILRVPGQLVTEALEVEASDVESSCELEPIKRHVGCKLDSR